MISAFLISLFGIVVGRRTFSGLAEMHLWTEASGDRLYFTFLIFQMAIFWLLWRHSGLLWSAEALLICVPYLSFLAQEIRRRACFRRSIVSLLDFLSLQMSSGSSMRESLQSAYESFPVLKYDLREILSLLQFESKKETLRKDPLFREVCRELVLIHQGAFKSIERIKALRNKIKSEQDFRRKSAQVTSQVKLQAMVLIFLYLSLLVFVMVSHAWAEISSLVVISVALFGLGLLVLLWIPRRFKWKV